MRHNLVELEVDGPGGHIEGLSLRLYDPESRQWSLNFANSRSGILTPPVVGAFKNGRGEFFGQETLDGGAEHPVGDAEGQGGGLGQALLELAIEARVAHHAAGEAGGQLIHGHRASCPES